MMDRPQTFQGDLAHLPPALAPLTFQQRWVVWRWELRTTKGGASKWTKPPYQALFPKSPAKSNNPRTWGSYEDGLEAVAAGEADGIGYMLLDGDLGALDLDHCRNPETGALETWAEDLHAEADGAYCEITVSGAGLRLLGLANGPETHKRFAFDRHGAGLEIYRATPRYVTISGQEVGHCPELPLFDDFIDRIRARHEGRANGAHTSSGNGLDFNDAGRQFDFDDLIRNGAPEGQRSEAFQAVIWHLAGRGLTTEEIVDELAQYPNGIGVKYADRLHAEVTRSYEKWRSHKRSTATGESSQSVGAWPQIFVKPGEIPRVVNEAEDALLALGREIYQRGGLIVRPALSKLAAADARETLGWRLARVTQPYLVETFSRAARFLKYDARAKGFVATDAPGKVADVYLAREGEWRLPALAGIVTTPFLRPDGSLCQRPGYDSSTGLLYKPDGAAFPDIPQEPTKDDALAALATLEGVIETFPFVSPADRAVALSALLSTLDRRAMTSAPLHGFTAPSAGTGKSLLVDLIGMIATGRLMPVIDQGHNEEELGKRLGAALLAGDAAISIDNCDHILQSALLCQALTQQSLKIRVLGSSTNIETPVSAAIFATGNNLTIADDLTRRTLLCSMDAHCERPELRVFKDDVLQFARAERPKLVAAALTVLRGRHLARAKEPDVLPPLGSFEGWSRRVRETLVWLGRADPCDTMAKVRDNDPARERLRTVLAQWHEILGCAQSYVVQQIIDRAVNNIDLQTALLAVAGSRSGNVVNNVNLGRWLKKVEGKIVDGFALGRSGMRDGYPLWKLTGH